MGRTSIACCLVLIGAGCGAAAPAAEQSAAASNRQRARELQPLDAEEAQAAKAQALRAFVQAQTLLERCAAEHDEAVCGRARQVYRVAADTWNTLVIGRPQDPEVGEWRVQRAQALLRGGDPAEAAAAAQEYLAAGTDPTWQRAAAETLVGARERLLTAARLEARSAAPEPEGEPPAVRALEIPQPLSNLREARERYLEVVPEATDTATTRRAYALDDALLLYRYGHWPEARTALQASFEAGCAGEAGWDGAATAWRALRDMAASLGRFDAIGELGRALDERRCDFGAAGAPACGDVSDDPRCIARTDAVSVRLRTGLVLAQRAEHARGDERIRWATRAGEAFLASVDEGPDVAPIERVDGLTLAARAFRLAGSDRAAEVDRRIAAEVVASRFGGEERLRALTALADALERSMALAHDSARHDEVVRFATRLLGPDFDQPELAGSRSSARTALPESLMALGRHREASEAWAALAAAETDAALKRAASLASALELAAGGDCRRAMVALRAFAGAHRAEAGAGDDVVRALYRYATCQREGSAARVAALDEVAAVASETHDALGAEARGYAAAAVFARADSGFDDLARLRIVIARGANSEALVAALREALRDPADEVRELLEDYDGVIRFDDPRWSMAAYLRAGLALERLADTVLTASWSNPADLEAERRTLTRQSYEQLRGIVAMRVREILETQARPLRCRAIERFDRAVAIAGRTGAQSAELDAARARLAAIDESVVSRCRAARPAAPR